MSAGSRWALSGATILTMEAEPGPADTLTVEGEIIRQVDRVTELEDELSSVDEVVNADGMAILPGFIDTHVHVVSTGLLHFKEDLTSAATLALALRRVAEAAAERPPGAWVLADGLAAGLLSDEARLPTREELDAIAADRPIYVGERTGHASVTNSLGWQRLGLPPDVEPGEGGILTARSNTLASARADHLLAEQVGYARVVEAACREAVAHGLTSLHALDGSLPRDDPGVQALVSRPAAIGPRLRVYYQSWEVEAVASLGLRQVGGCSACGLDGAFTPRTARLLEPYADGSGHQGRLYFEDEDLLANFRRAHGAGLQISVHCVGDGAVEQALKTYEQVLREAPRPDHRHRIEHAELITDDQLRRARRLGIALAIQPAFNHFWRHDGFYPAVIGRERAERVDPIASLLRAGLLVAGGSDSPVTPLRPLLGIHSAVNHSNPDERVSVEQAVRLFTESAARIGHAETRLGTLSQGKLADFVVLEANPLEVDPSEIKDIPVAMTVVGGRVAHAA